MKNRNKTNPINTIPMAVKYPVIRIKSIISLASSVTPLLSVVNKIKMKTLIKKNVIGTQINNPVEPFIIWPVFVIMEYPILTTPARNMIVNTAEKIKDTEGANPFILSVQSKIESFNVPWLSLNIVLALALTSG